MWWKIIIIVLALIMISYHWDEKIEKRRDKKRLYKFLMGLTYLVTTVVVILLIKYLGDEFYIYILGGVIFGIGSLLSAINPNLREIYATLVTCGFIMLIISPYFNSHKVLITIVDVVLACGFLSTSKDYINNIRNGIDIDLVREKEEKKKKWKNGFKLARLLIGAWFH